MDWFNNCMDSKIDEIEGALVKINNQAELILRIDEIEKNVFRNLALTKVTQQENKGIRSLNNKRLQLIEEKLVKIENKVIVDSLGKISQI